MKADNLTIHPQVGDLIYCDKEHLANAFGVCVIVAMSQTKKTWHRMLDLVSLKTGAHFVVPYVNIKHSMRVVSSNDENN